MDRASGNQEINFTRGLGSITNRKGRVSFDLHFPSIRATLETATSMVRDYSYSTTGIGTKGTTLMASHKVKALIFGAMALPIKVNSKMGSGLATEYGSSVLRNMKVLT
jgi:hypothetical protein